MQETAPRPETQDERTQRQLATLRELSDLALSLVRQAARHALEAPPEPADKPNRNSPRQYFERLAKCLRATITLENRIAGAKLPVAAARPRPTPGPPADPAKILDDINAVRRLYKSLSLNEPGKTRGP